MHITPCTIADIPVLLSVAIQSYNEHYTHLWYDNGLKYVKSNFNPPRIHKEISDSNARFFLMYNQDVAVGFLKVNIHKPIAAYDGVAALELERIYIIKQASGKGVGKNAIDFVVQLAREEHKKIVWLKAMDTSAAVGFYEAQGFEIKGESYLTFPEMKPEFRRMVLMMKYL